MALLNAERYAERSVQRQVRPAAGAGAALLRSRPAPLRTGGAVGLPHAAPQRALRRACCAARALPIGACAMQGVHARTGPRAARLASPAPRPAACTRCALPPGGGWPGGAALRVAAARGQHALRGRGGLLLRLRRRPACVVLRWAVACRGGNSANGPASVLLPLRALPATPLPPPPHLHPNGSGPHALSRPP